MTLLRKTQRSRRAQLEKSSELAGVKGGPTMARVGPVQQMIALIDSPEGIQAE